MEGRVLQKENPWGLIVTCSSFSPFLSLHLQLTWLLNSFSLSLTSTLEWVADEQRVTGLALFLDELETRGTIKPISNLCFPCLCVYLTWNSVTRKKKKGNDSGWKEWTWNLQGNLTCILLLHMMTISGSEWRETRREKWEEERWKREGGER